VSLISMTNEFCKIPSKLWICVLTEFMFIFVIDMHGK